MASGNHVVAVFHDRAKADRAMERLGQEGFPPDHISLLVSEGGRNKHFTVSDDTTKAPEGAAYGATIAGLVGGLTAAAIPGSIFVAGPLVGAFAVGGTSAAAGGLIGGLIGLGVSEDEAKLVEKEVGEGSIVAAVSEEDSGRRKRAKELLKEEKAARVH